MDHLNKKMVSVTTTGKQNQMTRKAKALIKGVWQDVLFHDLYQVRDVDYADVMAVIETKGGKLRKVSLNNIELEVDPKQHKLFEDEVDQS
jgi:hypothetical protein